MSKKQAKSIYKKQYFLGEGYPWGLGPSNNVNAVCLLPEPMGNMLHIKLDWPIELWNPELPKYRLILERIDEPT